MLPTSTYIPPWEGQINCSLATQQDTTRSSEHRRRHGLTVGPTTFRLSHQWTGKAHSRGGVWYFNSNDWQLLHLVPEQGRHDEGNKEAHLHIHKSPKNDAFNAKQQSSIKTIRYHHQQPSASSIQRRPREPNRKRGPPTI